LYFGRIFTILAEKYWNQGKHEETGVDVSDKIWFGVCIVCKYSLIQKSVPHIQFRITELTLTLARKLEAVHRKTVIKSKKRPSGCLQALFFHLVSFAMSLLKLAIDSMIDAALEAEPVLAF
jgi:hypothetical protein